MLVVRVNTLRISKYKVIQTLINILVNIIPYYFVKFRWYRRLIYHSTNEYNPIDLDLLHESLNSYSGELDMYNYYENAHLNKYSF